METTTHFQQKFTMAAASDVGDERKENEDFYYFSRSKKFFVVCDGMGGHQKGDLASKMAGETLRDLMFGSETVRNTVINNKFFEIPKVCEDISESFPMQVLKLIAAIRLANHRIFWTASRHSYLKGMGTTISAVAFHEGHITVAHVGDSRVYRLRDGELTCLTSDHSWLNELIEDNEINPQQAKDFEKKNVLTRALGIYPTVSVDLKIEPVKPNDLYLLCSDGVHNALTRELMESILCAYHGSLQNKISNLVKSAKMMDASDNITGGLVHISGEWELPGRIIDEKYAITDESKDVSNYLDSSVKSIYRKSGSIKNGWFKKLIVAGAILLIAAYTLLRFMTAEITF